MPPLQVKGCPENVYERLRTLAKNNNWSISNQVLTILEGFLDAYDNGMLEAAKVPGGKRIIVYNRDGDPAIRERRRKLFARIESRKPIPITETAPRANVILAQIREEKMK